MLLWTMVAAGLCFAGSSLVMAQPAIPLAPVPPVVGAKFEYTVQPGDYLIKIGARFAVAAEMLASENGLKYDALMKPGQKLVIENFHIVPEVRGDGLLINLPQRMLYLFRSGELAAAYPVGLGKPSWPTPDGDFTVVEKVENKAWVVPKSIQEEMRREGQQVKKKVPPGPDNPLGKHWLGLSIPGIGIHGTIAPASIYHFQSHGCIRLHPDDIAALFEQVVHGETGSIIYVPVLLAESDGKIYLEVHRDIYEAADVSLTAVKKLAQDLMLTDRINWDHAAEVAERHEGAARDVTLTTGINHDNE
jgi:L,D-transpeptidase ErfK/SrfK